MTEERAFEELVKDLERLEAIADGWEVEQKATLQALRTTLEQIQAGAFKRLVRTVKDHGGIDGLVKAVEDPWVQGVLSYHGLLKAPPPRIESRVEAALESVRPMLASHQGNVELVSVPSEEEVHIRLIGSCDGCTFSDATVRMGIETAIVEAVPTVTKVKVVNQTSGDQLVAIGGIDKSPFDRPWTDVGPAPAEGTVRAVELEKASILVANVNGRVKAYPNACAHLGMPLDGGEVKDGVLTCPYHGFQFELASGECITAPQVALTPYPTREQDGTVQVQVGA